MPFVVPTIPVSSFTSDGAAGGRDITPARDGFMSGVGCNISAWPPNGMETAIIGWGFWAGPAPPGTSTLSFLARGFSSVRGFCYSCPGYARAFATVNATVEEWEPTERPVDVPGGLFDRPDPADIHLPPPERPGAFRLSRTVRGAPIILINLETSVFGVQVVSFDEQRDAPGLFMSSTPGNFYRCWIKSLQWAMSGANGAAVSTMVFDFGAASFIFD